MSSVLPPRRRGIRRIMVVFLLLLCAVVVVVTQLAPDTGGLPAGVTTKPVPGAVYTECAREDGVCRFSGTASVRYGSQGHYHYVTRANAVPCNNQTFGDPAKGESKSCAYALSK